MTTADRELAPCPFCGGEAEQVDFDTAKLSDDDPNANAGGSCIACKQCGASSSVHFDRKENLYSSWNERSRAADTASPASVTEEQIARAICCPEGCLREAPPTADCWAGRKRMEREQARAILALIRRQT